MFRFRVVPALVLLVLGTGAFAAGAAPPAPNPHAPGPVQLAPAAADSLRAAIEKDRKDTEEWLRTSPTSYLATVQRRDFGDRTTMVVGSQAKADVRIDDPLIRPEHLRVTVTGDSFRVEALAAGAGFVAHKDTLTAATLPPSSIEIGRYTVRLSHQRFPALIVFDPKSPRFAEYKGMPWYPVDFGWRFVVPLTPNPSPDTVVIVSTRGNQRHALRVGWFDFKAAGKPCRLEVTRLLEPGVGENDVGVFFTDATTGKDSYGVGRYLDPERLPDGRYVLDFNAAYNPACAFSEHYNCPIPTKANRLAVAVRAGAMDPHYLSH
jgi:uncharacterized protein (DUF1684 family)